MRILKMNSFLGFFFAYWLASRSKCKGPGFDSRGNSGFSDHFSLKKRFYSHPGFKNITSVVKKNYEKIALKMWSHFPNHSELLSCSAARESGLAHIACWQNNLRVISLESVPRSALLSFTFLINWAVLRLNVINNDGQTAIMFLVVPLKVNGITPSYYHCNVWNRMLYFEGTLNIPFRFCLFVY